MSDFLLNDDLGSSKGERHFFGALAALELGWMADTS